MGDSDFFRGIFLIGLLAQIIDESNNFVKDWLNIVPSVIEVLETDGNLHGRCVMLVSIHFVILPLIGSREMSAD